MKAATVDALKSLNSIIAALDTQREAAARFQGTVAALATEMNTMAEGVSSYSDGLDCLYDRTAALGEECRGFAASPMLKQPA